ncbi:StbB family protein [Aeromonas sp. Y311-2]|jgi:hypothetical protein|uniref:StbB family protein n=1 Tax=Aeromonas sp. Y311-2 TaxID=2990507 RepID=UPI0022E8833B|nr:StbB family protein [Aeromonas sp. Y311-2]
MKVVVASKTGFVGKTALSAHWLKSMMPSAELFSIEDMNQAADALGVEVTVMNGGQFPELMNRIMIEDEAIIDVGMSNVRFFIDGLRKFEGSCHEFDYFLVPVTPEKRSQEEACETINTLLEIGVDPARIRPLFNKIPTTFFNYEQFQGFISYLKKHTKVETNIKWAIEENQAFEMLSRHGLSLATVVADTRDYRGEARALVMKAKAEGKNPNAKEIEHLTSMNTLRMCSIPLMEKLTHLWESLNLTKQTA